MEEALLAEGVAARGRQGVEEEGDADLALEFRDNVVDEGDEGRRRFVGDGGGGSGRQGTLFLLLLGHSRAFARQPAIAAITHVALHRTIVGVGNLLWTATGRRERGVRVGAVAGILTVALDLSYARDLLVAVLFVLVGTRVRGQVLRHCRRDLVKGVVDV